MTIRQPIKDIGKQTALYGLGNTLSKLAAFFLIPLYTRYLLAAEVGILALLEMMELFLVTIAPMGIVRALWRFLPKASDDDQGQMVISAFVGTLTVSLVVLALIGANYSRLSIFFGLGESDATMVLIVLLNTILALGIRLCLSLWQYRQKAINYVALSSVQFLGVLVVTIVFVVVKGWGLWGVLLAKASVFGLIFIYCGFAVLSTYRATPSALAFIKLLKYGSPLILLALVTPVLTVSDRFFLKMFNISLDDIGIYSIGYRFGMLVNMFLVVPLQRGWGPMMYRLGLEQESHEFHRDVMFYYAVVGSLFFLFISLFAGKIVSFVATKDYLAGALIVPIIAAAYLVAGFRYFFVAGAALQDKTTRLALAASIGILTNLVLNYALIRRYGVTGAAWATFLSYLTLVVLVCFASQRLVHIDWRWSRLLRLTFVLLVTFVITRQAQVHFQEWETLLGLAGIALFVGVLFLTRTVGHREINGIKSLMGLVKNRD